MTTITTQPPTAGISTSDASSEPAPSGSGIQAGGPMTPFGGFRDIAMQPFSPQSDPDDTGRAWITWKRELNSRFRFFRIPIEDRFDALSIYGGTHIRDLLEALVLDDNTVETADGMPDFAVTMQKLDEHFDPLINKDSARNKFEHMVQQSDESIAEYHVRLKSQARKCQFADCNDTIRSKLLQTMIDKKLRREAMTKSYTLQQLLTQAAHKEAIERQAKCIEGSSRSVNAVQAVHTKSNLNKRSNQQRPIQQRPAQVQHTQVNSAQPEQCPHCARTHDGGRSNCPASGKKCNACGKLGHFSVACIKPKQAPHRSATSSSHKSSYGNKSYKGKPTVKAHQVVTNQNFSESDDEYVFAVSNLREKTKGSTVVVRIQGVLGKANVDSCASANVMDENHFHNIKRHSKQHMNMKKTETSLFAYAQKNPVKLIGETEMTIHSATTGKSVNATFLITKGNTHSHPILSLETSKQLQLVHIVNKICQANFEKPMEHLMSKYKSVFTGLGCHKYITARLLVDQNIQPVSHKRRKIPYHLEKKAKEEEERLQKLGVIEVVPGNSATTWCSNPVIVPKHNSDRIRYCSDMRVPNTAILRPVTEALTVEDIKVRLNGASHFSVLDMNEGYHQLRLEPESRHLTTFHGVNGKMRYKRLNYGTVSAQDIFDKAMDDTVGDLTGVIHIRDDFICFGKTQHEHDLALESLLKKFTDCGLTFNPKKCKISVPEIEFFGFKFSRKGIQPSASRVEHLHNMPAPKSVSEVKSLLGMAQYSASFIPNFAEITAPLRVLTHKNVHWKWTQREQDSFNKLKASLSDDSVLGYFETGLPTKLQVDAAPNGLGLIMLQLKAGKWQPVFCASRSLTDVETRYSQTEREALAIRWACERCYVYIIGTNFVIETDHAPLLPMFNNPNSRPPMRIERWITYLQQFSFALQYKPGKENGADYLSRHPIQSSSYDVRNSKIREEIVCAILKDTTPKAISLSEIQEETSVDSVMQVLMPMIQASDHTACKKNSVTADFSSVFNELSIAENIVLRDNRIVVPKSLQKRAVNICHEGHLGIVKTKQLLRSKIWFPGIDRLVEKTISQCLACQSVTNTKEREPLIMTETPKSPWSEVSADFCGPFPDGSLLLVLIDNYSKYPDVEIVRSTSAGSVLPVLEKMLATHGIPRLLRSDNGPPFNSQAFAEFCAEHGIKHKRVTPLWPEANGLAEAFMKPLKKTAQAAAVEGKCWKRAIYKFLGNYRTTPHPSTGFSPRYLCMGRSGRTKLPELQVTDPNYEEVEKKQSDSNEKNKEYADKRRHTSIAKFQEDDMVLVKQDKKNKLTASFEPTPYRITSVNGSMITANRVTDQKNVTRNSSFFKKIVLDDDQMSYDNVQDDDNEFVCNPDVTVDSHDNFTQSQIDIDHSEPENLRDAANGEYPDNNYIRENQEEVPICEHREVQSRYGRPYAQPRYLKDYVT